MIKLNNITKKRQSRVILDNISTTFEDKQHYAIFGESGSGKTTLLNIIAGYEQSDSGTLEIDNEATIEYLFQESLLFSNITVKENMLLKWLAKSDDLDTFETEYIKALQLFGMEKFASEKVDALSEEEKKHVELCQVFLMKPQIVLFDEPVSSLDSDNKSLIINAIHNNFIDSIVIMVCHEETKYFDDFTLLSLKKGRLAVYE